MPIISFSRLLIQYGSRETVKSCSGFWMELPLLVSKKSSKGFKLVSSNLQVLNMISVSLMLFWDWTTRMTWFIRTAVIFISDSLTKCEYLWGKDCNSLSVRHQSLVKCLGMCWVQQVLVEMNWWKQRFESQVCVKLVKMVVVPETGMATKSKEETFSHYLLRNVWATMCWFFLNSS